MIDTFILRLPKLNLPNITVASTFYKLIEEIGEAKEQLTVLEEFENTHNVNLILLTDDELNSIRVEFKEVLTDSLKEIVDISQTCVSLLFAFQESNQLTEDVIKNVLFEHLKEVTKKVGYSAKDFWFYEGPDNLKYQQLKPDSERLNMDEFYIVEKDGFKYMNLPYIKRKMNLQKTLDEIIVAAGYYAQLMGKYSRINGETVLKKNLSEQEIIHESLKHIIAIAHNTMDLLRNMSLQYNLNLEKIFDEHIEKLKLRKYL